MTHALALTHMELDELKQAWQTLDRRLAQQNTLLLHGRKRRTLRARLWPLALGQALQLLFGVLTIVIGVALWRTFTHIPLVLVLGIIVHVYGVVVVIASCVVLSHFARLDSSEPVLALQQRLAELRRAYVVGGAVVGLPWWLLWMVPPAVVAALRVEHGTHGAFPEWLIACFAVGVLGLLGTWWFHRWSRRPGREALAQRLMDGATGGSLRRACAELDALRAFESEA
jgi:hypothetical protein